MARHVRLERREGVAIVRLDRPPANAVTRELAEELCRAVAEAAGRPDTGALVLTGTGDCFSAGLDLKVVPGYDAPQHEALVASLTAAIRGLYGLPLPTVAAVNGHAVAAGTLFTLCCDYRVARESNTRFGLTGVRVDIPYPPAAMAVFEAELAPPDRRRMLLSARTFDAQDAVRWGIVDELQPPDRVLARALEVAADLAAMPAAAYARTKRQLREAALAKMGGSP